MQEITSAAAIRRLCQRWKREGLFIAFVPTMGSLHEGHASLIRRARRELGPKARVVVSIYVNPTQFGRGEDFSRYPRDLDRDLRLCRAEKVDAVFAPTDREMYPRREGASFSTYVVEEGLSQRMEGISRPGHFRGVTTIVAKLFNLVQPDVAIFGSKDWQQASVIRRMVRDLQFAVKVIVAPTVREPDGLAMSSRNRYLSGPLRAQATVLWRAIQGARELVRGTKVISVARLKARMAKWIRNEPDARLDYIEFFHPETLDPVSQVKRGTHLALAVCIGKTRLIDNARM
ncbi:MAG TPA: pantoate--beta-alanine ligase [Verrucomicrobiae bacterium]|nr:pantoate--beta-alanine ligase [Verrucomicrobiae bacterium]